MKSGRAQALRGQHECLRIFRMVLAAAQDRNDLALPNFAECQFGLEDFKHFNINELSSHILIS